MKKNAKACYNTLANTNVWENKLIDICMHAYIDLGYV